MKKTIGILSLCCILITATLFNISCAASNDNKTEIKNGGNTLVENENGEQVVEVNSLLVPFTTNDVLAKAELIVKGKVTEVIPPDSQGRFIENEEGLTVNTGNVFTYVIIKPERYLAGQSSLEEVTIRLVGGKLIDDEGRTQPFVVKAPWEPVFNVGEEVIVALVAPNYEAFKDIPLPQGISANYYVVNFGLFGKYLINDNIVTINNKDTDKQEQIVLSEFESKIAALRTKSNTVTP